MLDRTGIPEAVDLIWTVRSVLICVGLSRRWWERKKRKLLPVKNRGYCSRHGFAGGATSGTDFAAGFRYEKMNSADKPGYRKTLRIVDAVQPPIFGVAAHKSYFLFGETLLALGSGITNLTPREPSGARSVSLPETLPRLISAPPPEENAAPLPPHSPRFPRKPHAGNCAENSFSEETGNPFLLNNELIGSMMQYHVIFC